MRSSIDRPEQRRAGVSSAFPLSFFGLNQGGGPVRQRLPILSILLVDINAPAKLSTNSILRAWDLAGVSPGGRATWNGGGGALYQRSRGVYFGAAAQVGPDRWARSRVSVRGSSPACAPMHVGPNPAGGDACRYGLTVAGATGGAGRSGAPVSITYFHEPSGWRFQMVRKNPPRTRSWPSGPGARDS